MFRPGWLSICRFGSALIARQVGGVADSGVTWHSPARSLASRTAGSLLIEKTSVSIFGFGPQ